MAASLRINVATNALRALATTLEEVGVPEAQVDTRQQVEQVIADVIDITRLLRGAPRTCDACGAPITRKRYDDGHLESPADFARRRFCDLTCKGVGTRTHKTVAARTCRVCRAPIERHAGEPWSKYVRRSTCGSPACVGAARGDGPRKTPRETPLKGLRHPQTPPKTPQTPAQPRTPKALRVPKRTQTPPQTPAPPQPPARAPFAGFPDPRPATGDGAVRMRALGKPCPKHPTNTIGIYGCPACRAHERWRQGERNVTAKPSAEGGR